MAFKIEKRGASYRVRKMIDGHNICVSFDHSPSDKEIMLAMNEVLGKKEAEAREKMTFESAIAEYIEMKRNVLSPSTIRSYVNMSTNLSQTILKKNIYAITQVDINKEVNLMAVDKSPKTVRNYHGLISAVLSTYRPELRIYTTMPQKRKYEPYKPTVDDVKKLLKHIRENESIYFIPICLSCYGLRRGEVCCLTVEDLVEDTIHVCRSKVLDDKRNWIIKDTAKTESSDRYIPIAHWLADEIREAGKIYEGNPNQLLVCLHRSQEAVGIPKFPLHQLRHFFCAVISESNDEQTVLDLGGWETDHVMKANYRYSLTSQDDKKKRKALKPIEDIVAAGK